MITLVVRSAKSLSTSQHLACQPSTLGALPEIINATYEYQSSFLYHEVSELLFYVKMEYVRTILDRKVLRTGVEGEGVLDGGSLES